MAKQLSIFRRMLRLDPNLSLPQAVFDKSLDMAPIWIPALLGSSAMTYLAHITEWMSKWGPIIYGVTFLLTAFVMTIIYAIYAWASKILTVKHFLEVRQEIRQINPLATLFSKQQINVNDFYNPYEPTRPVINAKFEDCDIFGPGLITLQGCTINGLRTLRSSIALFKNDLSPNMQQPAGIVQFINCNFERCNFFHLVICMQKDQYLHFKPMFDSGKLGVITDGTAGDL